jgi:DNA-binding response OmpR family regulator
MTRSRSVLIVEDEPLISMMLEDFVETLGHQVAGTCDCVSDALAQVEAGGFDLAIIDVHLRGGEASWPVADALSERGIGFLFSTGGSAELAPERYRNAPTLSKPFTMAGVESAIQALP